METLTKRIIEERFNKTKINGLDWMVPARFHQITDYKLIDKVDVKQIMSLSPDDFEKFWTKLIMYIQLNKKQDE